MAEFMCLLSPQDYTDWGRGQEGEGEKREKIIQREEEWDSTETTYHSIYEDKNKTNRESPVLSEPREQKHSCVMIPTHVLFER